MAEWLYEAGIGEARAALIEGGIIVEALIEAGGEGLRAGAVCEARLRANRIAECSDGLQILLDTAPERMTEGAAARVLVTRESLSEPGKAKRAKGRVVSADTSLTPGPTLAERIAASGVAVTELLPHAPDALEEAGWSEILEQAATGQIPFAFGMLQISLTPAMTLIDIDGTGPLEQVATEGILAAGRAIRCFGISGSIGIDVPTLADKAQRQSVAARLSETLPGPFEATAINGFGFMQIVRPRKRASLLEIVQYDRVGSVARALLRRVKRCGLSGAVTLTANSRIVAELAAHPDWLAVLGRQLGGTVTLQSDPALGMDAGYAAVPS